MTNSATDFSDDRCLRDALWLWGHAAGSHNDRHGLTQTSRIRVEDAAECMGIPNLIMVTYGNEPRPPLSPWAERCSRLRRVVWSIIGEASSTRHDKETDLDHVIDLADRFPNISGAIMDDFFRKTPGGIAGRYARSDVAFFRKALHAAARPLDLWVVVYDHELAHPIEGAMSECDIISFWTWTAEELANLDNNLDRLEAKSQGMRTVLGCYMWDYGNSRPMSVEGMRFQCETGLRRLQERRIEGMVFLASCICDLDLEAVKWTRDWIREVGDEPLRAAADGRR